MKDLLGCDVVHYIISEPSRQSSWFPLMFVTPDFIVCGTWGGKREVVVVEVKSAASKT